MNTIPSQTFVEQITGFQRTELNTKNTPNTKNIKNKGWYLLYDSEDFTKFQLFAIMCDLNEFFDTIGRTFQKKFLLSNCLQGIFLYFENLELKKLF